MFFKKKAQAKGIPIDEVRKMTKKGMSDKDIIKKLKSSGYSYDEIESAMLQAVKSGVTEEPMTREVEPEIPEFESFYEQKPQPEQEFSSLPELEADLPQEIEDPSIMLEELVEGVIDEKWHKFEDNMKKMQDDLNRFRAEMQQFEQRIELTKKDSPARDLEIRINDITEQLEDINARVGGLEKAFRQFLPSLTKNIESLSRMIHELKSKQSASFEEPAKF
jgi:DNA-binding transcriptional MerR regulator